MNGFHGVWSIVPGQQSWATLVETALQATPGDAIASAPEETV
jgi:hypothetical protein